MPASGVRIVGLRETIRSFNRLSRDLGREVHAALKAVAEPVARSARDKLSRYEGASIGTVRPRSAMRGVYVTQGARKKTGLRPDFGALQMTRAMIPALEEHAGGIEAAAGAAVDDLIESF